MAIQVCGWCISNLAFVFIYLFITDPFMKWVLAASFNVFVCIIASSDPIVLLITRQGKFKKFYFKIILVRNIDRLFTNNFHGFQIFIN